MLVNQRQNLIVRESDVDEKSRNVQSDDVNEKSRNIQSDDVRRMTPKVLDNVNQNAKL